MNRMVIPPGPVTDSGPTAGLADERGDLAVRVKLTGIGGARTLHGRLRRRRVRRWTSLKSSTYIRVSHTFRRIPATNASTPPDSSSTM
jgi:hypothetical protein